MRPDNLCAQRTKKDVIVVIASKELIAAGRNACRKRLEAMGFTRHEEDIYTMPLALHLFGWVGLARGIRRGDGSMDITPLVGLLHQDTQRVVAACAHLPYHRYYPATVQTNVGRLMPGAASLYVVFHPQQPADEPAERVCQPIGEYGIPWMQEHASLAAIYDLLTSGSFSKGDLSTFKPPVVAWMLGRSDLAHQLVRERLTQIAEEEGPNVEVALDVYGRFAAELEKWMETHVYTPPLSEAT
jgi:hypothetical protein